MLMEEHRLRVPDNKVLKRLFGPKKEGATENYTRSFRSYIYHFM